MPDEDTRPDGSIVTEAVAPAPPAAPAAVATVITAPMGALRDDTSQLNLFILKSLAWVLVLCILYEFALGGASWVAPAADGQGSNSVHDVIKTVITFILGIFSGIVQARIIGAGSKAH